MWGCSAQSTRTRCLMRLLVASSGGFRPQAYGPKVLVACRWGPCVSLCCSIQPCHLSAHTCSRAERHRVREGGRLGVRHGSLKSLKNNTTLLLGQSTFLSRRCELWTTKRGALRSYMNRKKCRGEEGNPFRDGRRRGDPGETRNPEPFNLILFGTAATQYF